MIKAKPILETNKNATHQLKSLNLLVNPNLLQVFPVVEIKKKTSKSRQFEISLPQNAVLIKIGLVLKVKLLAIVKNNLKFVILFHIKDYVYFQIFNFCS